MSQERTYNKILYDTVVLIGLHILVELLILLAIFSENYDEYMMKKNDDTETFFTLGKGLCEANHCQTAGQMTLIKVDTHAQSTQTGLNGE